VSKYRIEIGKKPLKVLSTLKRADQQRIKTVIYLLSDNPIPRTALKLSNEESYRIRVGLYRVIYTIEHKILRIQVIEIGHRKEVYR
jgi:mRNA interferase RelE/StbE